MYVNKISYREMERSRTKQNKTKTKKKNTKRMGKNTFVQTMPIEFGDIK